MKKHLRGISILLAVMMLIAMQFTFAFAAEDSEAEIPEPMLGKIVILHTNDVHSRVDDNLGYASVKAWKDYYEADGGTVIVLEAGDVLHGLPIANLGQGENIVDIMNEVGYTAMTPGNHDFNYGTARLLELKKDMKFDLLSANLTDEKGNAVLTPSKLYEKNGRKIGIVGISTPETATKTNPLNVKGYTFNADKLAEMVQTQIDSLKADGAEYIIALGHLGLDESSKPYRSSDIIAATEGIDIFIDGHSHTTLENGKTVKDKDGCDVLIAQTGNYLSAIGRVAIGRDGSKTASLITEAKPDEGVTALISEKKAEIQPMLDTVVAKTTVDLNGERAPGVRTQETNLGDLAADALKYTAGADVALTNGGGIRVSLAKGNITYGDLNSVFPFGNVVVSVNLKGSDILAALEHGTKSCPEASGGFPQVAGMSFEINTAVSENRVRNVKIGDEPLDLNKTYSLATNDFTKVGGDGYTMLNVETTGEFGALDEALVNYIEKALNGTVGEKYAAPQGRITIVNEPAVVEFEDTANHWAKDSIAKTVEKGLFNGVTETKFAPETSMTRGMFATVLARYSKADLTKYTESSFSDVSIKKWYGQSVEWALEQAVVSGMGISSVTNQPYFAPEQAISREQMAVMITNYCKNVGKGPVGEWAIRLDYSDLENVSSWAGEGVMFCTMRGYMGGYPDGTFGPKKMITRAEAAVILDRLIEDIEQEK